MKSIKEIIEQTTENDKIFKSEKISNEEIVVLTEKQNATLSDVFYYTNSDGEIVWVYEISFKDVTTLEVKKYHAFATTVMKKRFTAILDAYIKEGADIKQMREDFKRQGILFKITKTQNKKGQMTYLPVFA